QARVRVRISSRSTAEYFRFDDGIRFFWVWVRCAAMLPEALNGQREQMDRGRTRHPRRRATPSARAIIAPEQGGPQVTIHGPRILQRTPYPDVHPLPPQQPAARVTEEPGATDGGGLFRRHQRGTAA